MDIWVDADACPVPVREMLYRAATRTGIRVTLIANRTLRVPQSPWIRMTQVPQGFDVADHYIAGAVKAGDLVITSDIPLAAIVVEKGAQALSPRGEAYSRENVRELLDLRNFMDGLRSSGTVTGGPPAYSGTDRHAFASQLDRLLASRPKTV